MRKLLKYIAFLIPWLVVYVIIVEAYNKQIGDISPHERAWCKEFQPKLWADECCDYLDGPEQ